MKTKILIVLSLVVIVLFYLQHRKIRGYKDTSQLQAVELSQLKDTVLTYVTKSGQLITKIKMIEVDKRNLREALELSGHEIKDLKEKEIRYKNLIAVMELKIQAFGEGTANVTDTLIINNTDTVYVQIIRDWTDSRLSLFDMRIQNNEFKFGYIYNIDKMNLFVEEKKDSYVVTATFNQPGLVVTSGSSIVIENKKGFFERPLVWGVVGLGAGILIAK